MPKKYEFCIDLKDDYNRTIQEVNDIIRNTYKYTNKIRHVYRFYMVDSINGYYKKYTYRQTTGGTWVLQE